MSRDKKIRESSILTRAERIMLNNTFSIRQSILKYSSLFTIIFWLIQIYNIIKLTFGSPEYIFALILLLVPTMFILSASLIKLIGIKKFDNSNHIKLMQNFLYKKEHPSVDIFLPICGEPDSVIIETWKAVKKLDYPNIKVYVLDDKKERSKRIIAEDFKFNYLTRDNNEYKKAGNLRNAFEQTKGEFILIIDADFKPENNFLHHTLPYFNDKEIAIVQTPQAFDYKNKKGLEQGAGNIQDFFYSIVQPARDSFGGAICVGTNAVYRRTALDKIGGNVLIEHSEDVWTGFALIKAGYKLKYIPYNLAYGDCPDNPYAYFKQQTRWAQGSSSLVASKFFWETKLSVMQRLSYLSGFLFYVYSALILLFPLITIFGKPDNNQLLIGAGVYGISSMLITKFLIYKDSNINTMVAHCLATWSYTWALFNKFILQSNEAWQPTGSSKNTKSIGYKITISSMCIYTVFIVLFSAYITKSETPIIFILYSYINAFVHIATVLYLIRDYLTELKYFINLRIVKKAL